MSRMKRKSLHAPDGSLAFEHGSGAYVRVGALSVGRARLEPGWRWSTDVQPAVGTAWCEVHHLHVVLAGRFAVRMVDGEFAEFAEGDVCDIPPGHDAWVVGDEPADILDVSGNVETFGDRARAGRIVVTMLMTDMVGSTELAERLGDSAWRQLLERHNRIVRAQLNRFGGTEIDTTGDGFLATFQSAAAALNAAETIRDLVRDAGTEVRVGVHTGEVDLAHGDLRGVAVHATARIMGLGGASEVIVSATTRTLVADTQLSFKPLGPRALKGLAAPMEVFALA
jgi:class 3 adenylate cyclase